MLNKNITIISLVLCLASCGNPGNMSNEEYKEYKELGAPKILYSCTKEYPWFAMCIESGIAIVECMESDQLDEQIKYTDVGYSAGIGVYSTYNKLLSDAKENCEGEFKILEGKE